MNFTNTTFQNVPIPHLTCTMKLELSEGPVTPNFVNTKFSSHEPNVALTKELVYLYLIHAKIFANFIFSFTSQQEILGMYVVGASLKVHCLWSGGWPI